MDGVFYTEITFSAEAQLNRVWVDPERRLACEEAVVEGEHIATTLYTQTQVRDITAGQAAEPQPRVGDFPVPVREVLPYLGYLAEVEHEVVEREPYLVLEGRGKDDSGRTIVSRIELEKDTLFPRIQILTAVETGESASFLYEQTAVLTGDLKQDSRGTCQLE